MLEVSHDMNLGLDDVAGIVSIVEDLAVDFGYIEASEEMQPASVDLDCSLVGQRNTLYQPFFQASPQCCWHQRQYQKVS